MADKTFGEFAYMKEFQISLITHLCQDEEFFRYAHSMLRLQDFDLPACRIIFEALVGYYKKYETKPPESTLTAEVLRLVQNVGGYAQTILLPEEYESLTFVLERAIRPAQLDVPYTKDRLKEYIEFVRVSQIVSSQQDVLARGMGHRETIQKILAVNELTTSSSEYLITSPISEPEPVYSLSEFHRVSTGLPMLNKCIGGGLGLGEYGMLIACPGVGKTTTLINFGEGAACAGSRSLFITLELSERRIKHRYQAIHAFIDAQKMKRPMDEWPIEDVRRYQRMLDGSDPHQFLVADLSKTKYAVQDIENVIRKWKRTMEEQHKDDARAECVLVDWLDQLVPPADARNKDQKDWSALVRLNEEMARLARRYNVALWTATQGTRQADGAEIIRMEHAAFSYHKNDHADVVVGISAPKASIVAQTQGAEDVEKLDLACSRELCLTLAKNRDNPTGAFWVFQGPTLKLFSNKNEARQEAEKVANELNAELYQEQAQSSAKIGDQQAKTV